MSPHPQENAQLQLLRILQDRPDQSQRELARQMGISVGGLNYCLKALIDKGFVKMSNFQKNQNKAQYAYLLTPQGIAEKVALTSRFLLRKMDEYEALKAEIEALKSEVHCAQAPSKEAPKASGSGARLPEGFER